MTFKGKNALITGSSRGIGRGIALMLAEQGARIAIHYYQNRDAAQTTLESIRKLGSDGFLVQADVCQPDEVLKIFKQVRSEFGSQCQNGSADILRSPNGDHTRKVGYRNGFAGEGISGWHTRSSSSHVEWREDSRDHICARCQVRKLATLGCDGRGESSTGSVGAIFRRRIG